ncbi:MAG: alpha/beta fold hydrolase [Pseudomonadota bacterium]
MSPTLQPELSPDGTRYAVVGDGPALICLHGLGLDHTMWAPQLARLSQSFRVVCVDLMGHGGSAAPRAGARIEDFADQVLTLAEHLELTSFHVMGFDLGGQVAIALAARSPERTAGLALISTAYRRLKPQRDMMLRRLKQAENHGPEANADSAIQRWFSAAFQTDHRELVDQVRQCIAGSDRTGYLIASEVYAWADVTTADMLKHVNCPVLVMCGALDMGTTPDMARRLAAAISGAKLVIVPRQRHMLVMEEPELVGGTVTGHLLG